MLIENYSEISLIKSAPIQKIFLIILATYLIVGMHIVLPTPGGSGLYLSANIIGWCFISLLISTGLIAAYLQKSILLHHAFKFVILGIVFLLIPYLFDNDLKYFAVTRTLAVVGAFLLLISLFQCRFEHRFQDKIFLLLLIGVGLEVILGIIQFYVLTLFGIEVTGYTPLFAKPYGSFTQNNVMASFLATGIAMSLYLIFKKRNVYSSFWTYIAFFILVGSSLLLVLLQSKTGILGALIALTLLSIQAKKHWKLYKASILAILLGIALGVISQIYLKVPLKENILSDQGVRSTIYSVSIDMLKERPLTGFGYGNFERSYREYHLNAMQYDSELPPPLEDLGHPHNEILYWGVEGGLSALFGLALLFIGLFKLTWNQKTTADKAYALALVSPILLHSQLEYPFSHSIVHLVYLIILIWLVSSFKSETKQDKFNEKELSFGSRKITFLIALLIPSLTLPFMLTTLHTSYLMAKFKQSNNQVVEYITGIINPIAWQQYYEVVIYTQGLRNGYDNQDAKALKRYIDWGMEFVKQMPREGIYRNMLDAAKTLENIGYQDAVEMKLQINQEYLLLYPPHIPLRRDNKKAP